MAVNATICRILKKHSFKVVLCLALLTGIAGGVLRIDEAVMIAVLGASLGLWVFFVWRFNPSKTQDPGAWQRRIDSEYKIQIEGSKVTVFRLEQPVTQFEFKDPIEIQYISRRDSFPPLFWKIVLDAGEFTLPDGGRYANEFEKRFIYALPGYREQLVVNISPPNGFAGAKSMWRKDDPYPKVVRSDEEPDW